MELKSIMLLCVFCLISDTMGFLDIQDFFPSIDGNFTKVIWAHAVNNVTLLNNTLTNSGIMMIEADVQLGTLTSNDSVILPIMAHPPNNVSDLSLEMFLSTIDEHNKQNQTGITKKGIKLDFKEIDAFINSTSIIRSYSSQGNYPLWINADILPGPINATATPVNDSQFLENAKSFEEAWLSIGWTTLYGENMTGQYSDHHINEMLDTLKKHNFTNRITFPVRAGLAAESRTQMTKLLTECENSTLTVWSSEGDNVSVENLRQLIAAVGLNRVFIDVPDDLKSQLRLNDLPKPSRAVKAFAASIPIIVALLFIVI